MLVCSIASWIYEKCYTVTEIIKSQWWPTWRWYLIGVQLFYANIEHADGGEIVSSWARAKTVKLSWEIITEWTHIFKGWCKNSRLEREEVHSWLIELSILQLVVLPPTSCFCLFSHPVFSCVSLVSQLLCFSSACSFLFCSVLSGTQCCCAPCVPSLFLSVSCTFCTSLVPGFAPVLLPLFFFFYICKLCSLDSSLLQ